MLENRVSCVIPQTVIESGKKIMRIKYSILSAVFLLMAAANSLAAEIRAADATTAKTLTAGAEVAKPLPAAFADSEFSALKPFGNEFFRTPDPKKISVPMSYRIGPKDVISLVLGGAINARHRLTVDPSGRINIPRIGSVFVAGMTFEEMSKEVIRKLEETGGVHVDISMTALKTIPILVRGEVCRPGPHTVGAFATVTEALLFAGGFNENASVRSVQVRRKGITVALFDLYDFLLKGIKSKDITLMAGDEVFVPVRGPAVGITGSVSRPAVYELNDRYDLENLIGLAGGILPAAKSLQIQLARVTGNGRKVIYNASGQDISLKKSVPPLLQDRDLVRISPLAEISASVPAGGNVVPSVKDDTRPEIKPDIKTQLPLPEKISPSETGAERKPPEAAAVPGQNIPAGDSLKFVTLSGEFKTPGRYPITKGEKLSSVIQRAGGYTGNAYLRGAYLTRESVRQVQQQNLDDMARRLQQELFPQGEPSAARGADTGKTKSMPAEAELKQRFVEYMKSLKATGRLTVVITHLRLLQGRENDIAMETGDNLHLPQNPNVVNVIGAVMSEGPHIYNDKWDYREYISAAGGYAKYADEPDIFVIKVDGSARKLSRDLIEWSNKNERWEVTAFGQKVKKIESGDVIVVPEKITHLDWLKQNRDMTRLLMNTAVLTGRVLRLW